MRKIHYALTVIGSVPLGVGIVGVAAGAVEAYRWALFGTHNYHDPVFLTLVSAVLICLGFIPLLPVLEESEVVL